VSNLSVLRKLVGKENSSLPRIAAARADKSPDETFLIWEGRRYSYANCWTIMRQVGGLLNTLGINGNGARVATYLPNCPEALWTWFATHLTGSVYVPLNRAHKGALLADMLRRSGAAVLVTETAALDQLPDPASLGVEQVIVIDDDTPPGCIPFSAMESARLADPVFSSPFELCTLMYTSGTTGRSKAVRQPHNIYARPEDSGTRWKTPAPPGSVVCPMFFTFCYQRPKSPPIVLQHCAPAMLQSYRPIRSVNLNGVSMCACSMNSE
jgi:acyl-CoA synthetase (AMP-forming)/AMP-acid ligase II